MISDVNIKVPLTANCTPKDDTLISMTGTGTDGYSDENENEANDIINVSMLGKLNMYTDEVIAYVSGAVVKSVRKKIACQDCIENLTLEKGRHSLSSLEVRKTYGTLKSESEDVIFVCRTAEKVFKVQTSLVQPKIIDKMIITAPGMLPINALFAKKSTYSSKHLY
uniref:Uncharacterized protein n=1 Tax=Trichogramma kaykai TaxID=54128 RepID=A0ABD2WXR8_9HYME